MHKIVSLNGWTLALLLVAAAAGMGSGSLQARAQTPAAEPLPAAVVPAEPRPAAVVPAEPMAAEPIPTEPIPESPVAGMTPTVSAPANEMAEPTAAPVAATAAAPTFNDTLGAWADRLDARATEIAAQPVEPSARVGGGALLRKGASGERVWLLSHRLAQLGALADGGQSNVFNDTVDAAVRAFQQGAGLRPDGVVGQNTIAALDRSPQDSVQAMRRAAADMRALAAEGLDQVLLVNLPNQTVTLVRDGRMTFSMRAVVGRPSRETPLLRDEITHVIVNPTWTVPPTVLKEDKLPLLRTKGNPGISNAVVYLDGEVVQPELVDWSGVSPGRVRIVQQPGDHNALGRFRFNLTNPLNIYLHGTNEPRLFDRELRTVSSGCVRLHDARLLAEIVLAEVGVDATRIDQMLARVRPQWVKLAKPLPVRFTYWMATVDEAAEGVTDGTGAIRLHPDVYDMIELEPTEVANAPT